MEDESCESRTTTCGPLDALTHLRCQNTRLKTKFASERAMHPSKSSRDKQKFAKHFARSLNYVILMPFVLAACSLCHAFHQQPVSLPADDVWHPQQQVGQRGRTGTHNDQQTTSGIQSSAIPHYAPSEPPSQVDESSPPPTNTSNRQDQSPVSLRKALGTNAIVVEYHPNQRPHGMRNSRGPQNPTGAGDSTDNQTAAEDKIATKHKFTFTVNGKQLTLEPPKPVAQGKQSPASSRVDLLQPDSSNMSPIIETNDGRQLGPGFASDASGDNEANDDNADRADETKKVNRVGEFTAPSGSTDYDLGFDVGSGSATSTTTTASQSEIEAPNDIPLAGQTASASNNPNAFIKSGAPRLTGLLAPPSSSSSLMSQSRDHVPARHFEHHPEPDAGSDTNNTLASQVRGLGESKQANSYTYGEPTGVNRRIISDWPKALKQQQRQGHNTADRHTLATTPPPPPSVKLRTQSAAKWSQQERNNSRLQQQFSPLLSRSAATNDGQSTGAIRGLEAHKAAKLSPGAVNDFDDPKSATKSLAHSADAKSSSANYPRAPAAHVKIRHSPSNLRPQLAAPASSFNHNSIAPTNQSESNAADAKKQPAWSRSTPETPQQLKSSGWENESGETFLSFEPPTAAQRQPAISNSLGPLDLTHANDQPESIQEYQSNYANQAMSSATKSRASPAKSNHQEAARNHNGTSSKPVKAHISERDLSFRLYPLPARTIHLARSLRPDFVGERQLDIGRIVLNGTSSKGGLPARQPMLGNHDNFKLSSIVRTGTILPQPPATQSVQLRAMVPAAMALLAQAQSDPQSRAGHQLRALLVAQQQQQYDIHQQLVSMNPMHSNELVTAAASISSSAPSSTGGNNSGSPAGGGAFDQLLATANHMGVTHSNPQSGPPTSNLGVSESNSYKTIALQDYADRTSITGPSSDIAGGVNTMMDSSLSGPNMAGSNQSNQSGGDDQRALGPGAPNGPDPYQGSGSEPYESSSNTPAVNQMLQNHGNMSPKTNNDMLRNSRASSADIYLKSEHKSSDAAMGPMNHPRSSSLDPFEELTASLATSEYERDLADLDEEFTRHSGFRRPSSGSLMSDSYMTLSPERYEQQRYRGRPSSSNHIGDYASDYLSTAGSISSFIPRPYQRSPSSWSSIYSDGTDMWQDTNVDYSSLASLLSPSQYSYRARPRYHHHHHAVARQAYPSYAAAAPPGGASYLTTSASEQQLQPAYNIIPTSYGQSMPTESISFTLSPLAAAAAAAATALAAADKSRHQGHAWLALPRLASSLATTTGVPAATSSSASGGLAAASSPSSTGIPAGYQAATFLQRPGSYAMYGSTTMPIFAIAAPRPPNPLATAASGATPSIIPFYPGGSPAIIAYRPGGPILHSTPFLSGASFAYPYRLPLVAPAGATHPAHFRAHSSPLTIGPPPRSLTGTGGLSTLGSSGRPIYLQDLQFAETKPKSSNNASSSSDSKTSIIKVGGLTAMARNLTKKVFGTSASQIRPQHVAPPSNFNEILNAAQNSSNSAASAAS